MSGQHSAWPVRRRDGWRLWSVWCPECRCYLNVDGGREDAAALAKRHNTEKAATK